MNPDVIDSSATKASPRGRYPGNAWGPFRAILISSGLGAIAVLAGHWLARSAVVDVGPTDAGYVQGFRDVERDGSIYFRWTSVPSSTLSLPVRFCGPGSVRLRVRRHFVDPAVLTVSVGGRVLGQKSIQARTDHPYEVIEFPVLETPCLLNAAVLLETLVENDRSLGVAVDWVEVRSPDGFTPSLQTVLRGAVFLAITGIALWIAGCCRLSMIFGIGGILAALISVGIASSPVAGERILRGATAALAVTSVVGFLIARLSGIRRLPDSARTALVAITLATLVSRSAFLHTQAFYPDYRVHALVQHALNRLGLSRFLDQLFEIQYARSLGLQRIDGNWYPFPYPPGSYVLGSGVLRAFAFDAADASMVAAIAAASVIPTLTVAVGIALGLGEFVSVAGAFYIALQPLLVRRMALGYFPSLTGQFVDAIALLLLLRVLQSSHSSLRRLGTFALALLAAFLVYTQSIANFGLLATTLVFVELIRRSPRGREAAMRVALAGALSLSASIGLFYWRYLPVMENVASKRRQPEATVLDRLEQLRENSPLAQEIPEADDLNDPFEGSTLNPARGVARLGSRLWRFNGAFGFAIVMGGWFLWRQSALATQNFLLAWGAVPVWISLMAAGLPSPNGLQHLKDLEFVSPLLALALGALTKRVWDWSPVLGAALAGAWLTFALRAFGIELTERLITPADL